MSNDERDEPSSVSSAVRALDHSMGGAWLVRTRGSTHVWDLDAMTYTRRPGPDSGSGSMRFDGCAMPITGVEAWPEVGKSFVVWYDDPEDPDLMEHYRISSTVRSIRPLSRPAEAAESADVS